MMTKQLAVKLTRVEKSIKLERDDSTNMSTKFGYPSSSCQTCLGDNKVNSLKKMTQMYCYEDTFEIYSEMIEYCFALQIGKMSDTALKSSYLICESCVIRLRDAVNFRRQILDTQEVLQKKLVLGDQKNWESSYYNEKNDQISDVYLNRDDLSVDEKKDIAAVEYDSSSKSSGQKQTKDKKASAKIVKKTKTPKEKKKETVKKKKREAIWNGKYEHTPLYVLDKDQRHCKMCNDNFETRKALIEHMPTHFYKYTCEYCEKKFVRVSKYLLHRDTHLTELYLCPHCPTMKFKSQAIRMFHMRNKHTDNPVDFKCSFCGLRFPISYKIKHLIQAHNRTELLTHYQCKKCNKCFASSGSLNCHSVRCLTQERNVMCEVCGMKFFFKDNLQRHMVKHTGVRNFPCTVCGKAFLRDFTLSQHMKIHSGEKKFVCDICNKSFTYKCSLKGHMVSHYKEDAKKSKALPGIR